MLTPNQERFAHEYTIDYNGTQAAIRAGYAESGAGQEAYRLLKNVEISNLIDKLKQRQFDRTDINADKVLMESFRVANVDIARAVDENGKLLPLKEMPEDIRRAISSIEVETLYEGQGKEREAIGTLTKVKFWEKTKALDQLGKHFKLWNDRAELTGPNGEPVTIIVKTGVSDPKPKPANGA